MVGGDGATLTRFLYSGEQTDTTGLQYLRARPYNPRTGRFLRLACLPKSKSRETVAIP